MKKILYIQNPCYIKITNINTLEIIQKEKEIKQFTLDSLGVVLLESDRSTITTKVINKLTDNNINIIICNRRGLPNSHILSFNNSFKSSENLKNQILFLTEMSPELWKILIKNKIQNQINVMKLSDVKKDKIDKMITWKEEVVLGDTTNREAISAKMFFNCCHGTSFTRFGNDVTNHALDFGYHILASCLGRVVCAYGLIPSLGLHHISKTNYWNLVYDLIEPLRPLVNYWVVNNYRDLKDKLTKENKASLVNLINQRMLFNGQKRTVYSLMSDYIESLLSCFRKETTTELKTPEILKIEW